MRFVSIRGFFLILRYTGRFGRHVHSGKLEKTLWKKTNLCKFNSHLVLFKWNQFPCGLPFYQTYASNVLITLNPYEKIDELYGSRQMVKYLASNTFFEQPPHVYAIGKHIIIYGPYFILYIWVLKLNTFLANEALKNLKTRKKSQSILITGVTGSGKTENGKHIMEFLCQTSSQNVSKSVPILEAFGNAKTQGNANSSRFCKTIEVKHLLFIFVLRLLNIRSRCQLIFESNGKQLGAKIAYNLLETSRVSAVNLNESNFHIFYDLILGSPNDMLRNLCLDRFTQYKVRTRLLKYTMKN